VVGMCGAMEALNDAGLLDAFTYACGLSGSAWCVFCVGHRTCERKLLTYRV